MTDYSVFLKKQNNEVKLSSEEEPKNESGMLSGVLGKIKGYVTLSHTDDEANEAEKLANMGFVERTKYRMKKCIEVEKSYKVFFIVLSVGLGLVFLSLMFLPLAWVSPQRFVSLFSLGSLVILISFIFIYGTLDYFAMLFSKERALFSVLFVMSIFIGIYFAFNPTYYLISLACSILQMITLIIFTLSFIPGGRSGISFITGMLLSPIFGIWNKIRGS